MKPILIFHPWDSCHKIPFGAVKTGETITLTAFSPPDSGILSAELILRADSKAPDLRQKAVLLPSNGYYNRFRWRFSVEEAGLYFYRLEAFTQDGILFFGKGEDFSAVPGDFLPEWQLTVYEKEFFVPQKRQQGVIYQIFPDRFYRDPSLPLAKTPAPRLLHQSTTERPLFTMDQNPYKANDFFGGNLRGMIKKLPYLKRLGVTCIYLNPIFEAASNHRYDTGDYQKIDPWLGTEEDFSALAAAAKELGIDLLLDGVFSHTGADSIYFNRENHYPSPGAFQRQGSPYDSWYSFDDHGNYNCWWGFPTLPNVNETDPSFLKFICGEDGVAAHWLKKGASGWRLDVADELPDQFLFAIRRCVKNADPESFLLGEVWEDASNKESYGKRRFYLLGKQLDSVMNYPFREAILDFFKNGDGALFSRRILSIADHYPPPSLFSAMVPLSTHDTVRVLTFLAVEKSVPFEEQPDYRLSPEEYQKGKLLFRLAALLQYTLPGVPSLYYGDEAGLYGFSDPWNRRCYPWGGEDQELVDFFEKLGAIRSHYPDDLQKPIQFLIAAAGLMVFRRGKLTTIVSLDKKESSIALSGQPLIAVGEISCDGKKITAAPFSGAVVMQ